MKVFKRGLLGVLTLFLIIGIAVFGYIQSLKPTYSGSVAFPEAKGVEVFYDTIGVPHIFSESEEKAMLALGYIHAKERLWQMELLRRIASGRLSEILGKDLLEVDVFFLSLGIDATVEKQVKALEQYPKAKKMAQAYLEGINKYIMAGKTPVEFRMLGIEKEVYTFKDMYYVTAYMAFSFANAFKTDALLTHIKENLGGSYLKGLAIDSDATTFYQKNTNSSNFKTAISVRKLLKKLPFPQFIGSNAIVLGAKKTTTGKVILENDPHIDYAQPCVWYQAHIKTPTYERYGFYLGLLPYPLLAHNRQNGFGMTMFENDDINFYKFKNHPTDTTKYITSTGTHPYQYLKKKIKVKGEDSKTITIKNTVLGPVFNQHLTKVDSLQPIAVQWVYNEKPSTVLKTSHAINHAKNIKDFEQALSGFSAPGLNFVYGDVNNNIGLWSVGQLYQFSENVRTKYVLNGLDSLQTQKQWLSFDKNPKAVNPKSNYVITSNTQPQAVNGVLYQGYYLPKDRGVAIEKRIKGKNKLSVNDVKNIATSHTNSVLVANITELVKGLDLEQLTALELHVLDRLIKWKGNHYLENIEPAIYYKLTFTLLKNTFQDELGEDLFNDFVGTSLCKRTQNKFVGLENLEWWDNQTTSKKETKATIVQKSFKETVSALQAQLGDDMENWKWEKIHTLTHEHALAKLPLLKKFLNVSAGAIVGGNETVNNTMFDYTEDGLYPVNAGPSTRRVVDFSDVENSYAVLPTGQSGNFMSPYYKNQAAYYNVGKYYKMLINEEEIKKISQKMIFE